MSTEDNKELVSELFSRFSNGDITGVLGMMADDATWWIAGKAGTVPVAGTQSKEQIARLFHRMASQLKNGLKMNIKNMIAEGDSVAAEVESYGELENGRVYNQEYHMLIEIRNGKIRAVREYLDTQHVLAIWFQE